MNDLRIPVWWLLIAVGVILLMPFILTRSSFYLPFDFSDKGQIGDTIGGITSPFVGLLSAYLVYKAFIVQVEANKLQSRNNDFGIAIKLIDDVETRLNKRVYSFVVVGNGLGGDSNPVNAYKLIEKVKAIRSSNYFYYSEILHLMQHIVFLKDYIEKSDVFSPLDKERLRRKAYLCFGVDLEKSIGIFQRLYNWEVFNSLEDSTERLFVNEMNKFVSSTGNWFFNP